MVSAVFIFRKCLKPGSTILAQKSDGTIYDLQPIVSATGNYNY